MEDLGLKLLYLGRKLVFWLVFSVGNGRGFNLFYFGKNGKNFWFMLLLVVSFFFFKFCLSCCLDF